MDHCFALSHNPSRRWSGRPIDARPLFSGFSSRQEPPCRGPAFPVAWIGLSRNRFLRIPCSGVRSLGRLLGSIHEAAALKFPRPDEGGGSNLAKFPRMAGQFPVKTNKFPARLNKFPVRRELIPCFIL